MACIFGVHVFRYIHVIDCFKENVGEKNKASDYMIYEDLLKMSNRWWRRWWWRGDGGDCCGGCGAAIVLVVVVVVGENNA